MLRINHRKRPESAKKYYARGDYYGKGESLVGQWFGKAATLLGLNGTVDSDRFAALCDNQHPMTGEKLLKKVRDDRKVAYDFTFSAFKSASVLYALFEDTGILKAFHAAVLHTMQIIESNMHTRIPVGKSTINEKSGNLVAAPFTHFLSRPTDGWADPHLHTHMVAFNLTRDEKRQKWRAGEFRPIKERGDYFEEIFESHLANGLVKIGYPVERRKVGKKTKLEVQGVPDSVINAFSRRTKEIEEEIEEQDVTDPSVIHEWGARNRNSKSKSDGLKGEDLKNHWKAQIPQEFKQLEELYRRSLSGSAETVEPVIAQAPHPTAREMVDFAIRHCFERVSVVKEFDFLTVALQQGTGRVSVEELLKAVEESDIIREESKGKVWLTTGAVLREEFENINFVKDTKDTLMPLKMVTGPRDPKLSDEQWNAYEHVLKSADRITAVSGGPGSGKTTIMNPTVAKIEEAGFKVQVFAPSAKASRGVLRKEGFKNADTFQRFLIDTNLQKAATGQVVWIDEAGLLGSRDMHRLFALARERNFRVILSGDTGQHSPVPRGDAMRLLENHAGRTNSGNKSSAGLVEAH